ncbi:MAG: dihydrofolate reductase [Deltaproteobacteria bacterium]|nr:dihydrofolate reductase [Deltaproteobacteria bacterium]MBW2448236.1 dihydrofolate reductase [Deltaproteobacteria bacterium]
MGLTLVVACAENRVIGRDGGLPWRLPDDLRRFRRLTTGHAILMGRRTWESIGRPLPRRRNLVVTRAEINVPNVETHESLASALAATAVDPEPFVIGGEALYAAALPDANRIQLTRVHAEIEGDAFFPDVDWREWKLVADEPHAADERHAHAFTFETWERA